MSDLLIDVTDGIATLTMNRLTLGMRFRWKCAAACTHFLMSTRTTTACAAS